MAGAGGKAPAATKKSLKKMSPPETIGHFLGGLKDESTKIL